MYGNIDVFLCVFFLSTYRCLLDLISSTLFLRILQLLRSTSSHEPIAKRFHLIENIEHLRKQMTQGHNIVTDGRAGASNPPSTLSPLPFTLGSGIHKSIKTLGFHVSTRPSRTKGLKDGRTKSRAHKQGRIRGNPVADGWAGAVMQKPLGIQKCDGRTDGLTYRPTY